MKIGYTRISTNKQDEALQVDALQKAGCEKWYSDTMSGSKDERTGLAEALAYCRAGDVLVVWKLDRLGRSLQHLVATMNTLEERGIEFVSLTEQIDTTTPNGRFLFHLMAALAEFERDLIRERVKAGLEAARARGRVGGRPKSLQNGKVEMAQGLYDQGKRIEDICGVLRISRATLYRYIEPEKLEE